MTTIAFREYADRYELAADSKVSTNKNARFASTKKIHPVPDRFGGGYLAFCGDLEVCLDLVQHFTETGELKPSKEDVSCCIMHVSGTGARFTERGLSWMDINEEFVADGSGDQFAIGAMAMGADPAKAVDIASSYDSGSSAPVHSVSVPKTTIACRIYSA